MDAQMSLSIPRILNSWIRAGVQQHQSSAYARETQHGSRLIRPRNGLAFPLSELAKILQGGPLNPGSKGVPAFDAFLTLKSAKY